MEQDTMGELLFYGASGILQPGAILPTDARVTPSAAQALADAWHAADSTQTTPFLYQVAATTAGAIAVVSDVLIDGDLAARALAIANLSGC